MCVCLAQAMTEDEWENTAMERSSFLRCILSPILCIADAIHGTNDDGKTQAEKAVAEAKKQAQIAAAEAKKKAEAAQLQGYLGQCKCEQELIEDDFGGFIHSRDTRTLSNTDADDGESV